MSRRIETHLIAGPAGRLEALLEEPEQDPPRYAALVCHPHPLHGGTMHNKVVYRIARGLRRAGAAVLRFNYRGVNLSEGVYDHGAGETEDARVCLGWLRDRYPDLPYVLAGFSFGSRIVLKIGCAQPGARLILAAGFPAAYQDTSFLEPCYTPRVFLHSTNDQYGSIAELEAIVSTLSGPPEIEFIPAADHFFAGSLDALEDAVLRIGQSV